MGRRWTWLLVVSLVVNAVAAGFWYRDWQARRMVLQHALYTLSKVERYLALPGQTEGQFLAALTVAEVEQAQSLLWALNPRRADPALEEARMGQLNNAIWPIKGFAYNPERPAALLFPAPK